MKYNILNKKNLCFLSIIKYDKIIGIKLSKNYLNIRVMI